MNCKNIPKSKIVVWASILIVYLLTRVQIIHGGMNEYFDYDEGTYLMIARFINHGILPYRDVFAVHPPLYYYLLAVWLRLFGDNCIVGRSLSVVLGFASVIVAYLTGKELKDWKFGTLFALILVLDPTMVQMNSLVFHETSIELFTLLSLYYFVKYSRTREMRYAYLSLFWAGLGTTSKFTIIPYAVALYFALLFSLDGKTQEYLREAASLVFNRTQVFIIVLTFLVMTSLIVDVIVTYPSDYLRNILIVPGIHPIKTIGQIISVGISLAIWGVVFLYVTGISYMRPLLHILKSLARNFRTALKLAVAILFPKLLVEGILGFGVSGSYLSQTYLAQKSRYAPIINPFSYLHSILKHLYSTGTQDYLIVYVPLLVLLSLLLLQWARGYKLELERGLGPLLFLNFIMYFMIFPIVPNQRFLYPFFVVLYPVVLYALLGSGLSKKEVLGGVIVILLLVGIAGFSMAYRYSKGQLLMAWASHSEDLREELGKYIEENNLSDATYLSMNPFNTYYLHLKTDPWYLDVFGVTYLENPTHLEEAVNESDYVIFSTWMYAMEMESPIFKKIFGELERSSHLNYTLLFSESYDGGDVITLVKRDKAPKSVSFDSYMGKMRVWINGSPVFYISPSNISMDDNSYTQIKLVNGSYSVIQRGNKTVKFTVFQETDKIVVVFPETLNVTLEFDDAAAFLNHGRYAEPGEGGSFDVYVPEKELDFTILVDGVLRSKEPKRVVVECRKITIAFSREQ